MRLVLVSDSFIQGSLGATLIGPTAPTRFWVGKIGANQVWKVLRTAPYEIRRRTFGKSTCSHLTDKWQKKKNKIKMQPCMCMINNSSQNSWLLREHMSKIIRYLGFLISRNIINNRGKERNKEKKNFSAVSVFRDAIVVPWSENCRHLLKRAMSHRSSFSFRKAKVNLKNNGSVLL